MPETTPIYSISRALTHLVSPDDPGAAQAASAERHASSIIEARTGRAARGLSMPFVHRGLSTAAGEGGELVSGHITGFAGALRAASVLGTAGATFLYELHGRASVPTIAAGASAIWIDEGAGATGSTPTFAMGNMTPATVAAAVSYSRRMALQSSPQIDRLLEFDMAAAMATEIDAAGLGVSLDPNSPIGLLQAMSAEITTFAGSVPTWAELLAMEAEVRAETGSAQLGWITGVGMAKDLQQTIAGTASRFIMEGGRIGSHPAQVTNSIPDGAVIFGAWEDLLVGMWGGVDLRIDRSTNAASDGRVLRGFADVAFLIRRKSSFAVGVAP